MDLSVKAKQAIMALIRSGFNKNGWCPSAKINVFKLFIRPLMEYGMQVHLYDQKSMELFEKSQQLGLRIAFGVPWNTSKTALKRLSCLESMKCRNETLNAKFATELFQRSDTSLPAFLMIQNQIHVSKSIAAKWKKRNKNYHRFVQSDYGGLKQLIKTIRYENVSQDDLGRTQVSDAISVHANLKHSDLLFWNGAQDAQTKRQLIEWRLGRIAYHQPCASCNQPLSRKHAVMCSGAEDYLMDLFPDIQLPSSNTIIDTILNLFYFKNKSYVYNVVSEAISAIQGTCILHTRV